MGGPGHRAVGRSENMRGRGSSNVMGIHRVNRPKSGEVVIAPLPPPPSVPTALPQIDHPPLILPRGVKDGTIELLLRVILGFD